MCQPFYDAYKSIEKIDNSVSLIFTPQGKPFNQQIAQKLNKKKQIIMFCGHYEGYDERIEEGEYCLRYGEVCIELDLTNKEVSKNYNVSVLANACIMHY